jgi:hypothetical protein
MVFIHEGHARLNDVVDQYVLGAEVPGTEYGGERASLKLIANYQLRRLVLIGLICLVTITCWFALFGFWFYKTAPFPVPSPYMGAEATQAGLEIGAARRVRTFEYVVERPLDEVQWYYASEMSKYCKVGGNLLSGMMLVEGITLVE